MTTPEDADQTHPKMPKPPAPATAAPVVNVSPPDPAPAPAQAPPGQIEVKPKRTGMTVRDPITWRKLADAGAWVKDSSYWRRRILDGDAILITDR